jgi:D-threo-aldose 1-dehydrogenase
MNAVLPRRPLGRSGLTVSALGFGAAPLGDLYGRLDDQTAIDAVVGALTQGVSLIDAAPLYGHGLAEHRVGTAIRRFDRSQIEISTKVGRHMDPRRGRGDGSGYHGGQPHAAVIDYSRDGTLRSVEQSLLRLGTDRIDILLIHDVDVWTHGKDGFEQRYREAMDGAYPALHQLRAEGVVKAIGIGVNEADVCARFARAGDFDAMLLAGRYSLLEQPALDEFLPLALEKGIGVMLGGVFNSGVLATGPIPGAKYNYRDAPPEILARVARIQQVCGDHGADLATAALQFAMGHPAVSAVVLGAASPQEVTRNLAGLATPIAPALWSDLKDQGLLRAEAPVPA